MAGVGWWLPSLFFYVAQELTSSTDPSQGRLASRSDGDA
jgi:hypothetical protein